MRILFVQHTATFHFHFFCKIFANDLISIKGCCKSRAKTEAIFTINIIIKKQQTAL